MSIVSAGKKAREESFVSPKLLTGTSGIIATRESAADQTNLNSAVRQITIPICFAVKISTAPNVTQAIENARAAAIASSDLSASSLNLTTRLRRVFGSRRDFGIIARFRLGRRRENHKSRGDDE